MLQKKCDSGEKMGWHVRCAPPHHQHGRKEVFCERKQGGVRFTLPHYWHCREKVFCERKWGSVWGAHCPVINAAEKRCFARGNGAVCEIHTAPLLMPQRKGVLRRKRGSMWDSHCPVINATEKRCFARGNGAACEVHTAPLSMPQKKCFGRENGAACEVHTAPLSTPWKWTPCLQLPSLCSSPSVSPSTLPTPCWVCCDHVGWGAPGGLR